MRVWLLVMCWQHNTPKANANVGVKLDSNMVRLTAEVERDGIEAVASSPKHGIVSRGTSHSQVEWNQCAHSGNCYMAEA